MGSRGECSREQAKRAILLFAADEKKHKRSEFIKELVDKTKSFAKLTVYKYLNELVADECMKMEPGSRKDRFRPDYSITKLGLEAVERFEAQGYLDKMNIEDLRAWIHEFKKRGLLPKFTDKISIIGDNGKIKGKGVGFSLESKEYGTTITVIVKNKNGKKIQEIETDKDGNMRFIIRDGKELTE